MPDKCLLCLHDFICGVMISAPFAIPIYCEILSFPSLDDDVICAKYKYQGKMVPMLAVPFIHKISIFNIFVHVHALYRTSITLQITHSHSLRRAVLLFG